MLLNGVTEIAANTSKVKISIPHVIQKQFAQKIRSKSLFNLIFFVCFATFCVVGQKAVG